MHSVAVKHEDPGIAADLALVERMLADEDEAWTQFYARYDSLIRSVVSWRKWSFNELVREDVAQTIRGDLVKAIRGYRGTAPLDRYVKRIAFHRCVDEVRRQARRRQFVVQRRPVQTGRSPMPAEALSADFDPVAEVITAERANVVRQALRELQEMCRSTIACYYIEDMSYREMAKHLGVTISTAGSRLARCLEKLRRKIACDPLFREVA